jgi:ribonucleoside-triphosphate reductase
MEPNDYLSFRFGEDFIDSYRERQPNWGFPCGGGNSLGEFTYLTKYSRRKPDGSKERWYETCRRVVEGYYSILKDHCKQNRTPWNEQKAQRAAKDAYERLFSFKWTPPGRGLWMMGTEFTNGKQNSAALQNCAFISTEKLSTHSHAESVLPFIRMMEMSMLGVGVGFDTKGADKLTIHEPIEVIDELPDLIVIDDSREGWYDSVGDLLKSYFFQGQSAVYFDYSEIRPAGELIKGFGGVAAGPGPLIELHQNIRDLFDGRDGTKITSSDITDLMNMIGRCVVAGNVRRSAEIALGYSDDKAFLDLKNWEINPVRMAANTGWGNVSNNSVFAQVGENYDHLTERIAMNGEPGLLYLDLCREYGRLVDPPNNRDHRAAGTNPCGEQTLESYECCTLVETYPINCDDLDDFVATIKHAYLYAKAVTLLPTHWSETNEIMQRNRRIGCSVSGQAQFAERFDWPTMRTWLNTGYEAVQNRDRTYSEWLGVRESIKTTSVKPSGTVSLLSGVTPGVHWPTADVYIRRMRLAVNDPLLGAIKEAGYITEPDFMDPKHSVVVEFPTLGAQVRTEREVSIWEKAALAVLHQRYWADNQVSVTLTFKPEEEDQIGAVLRAFDGQLKSVSMLPLLEGGAYRQMPYERISEETREQMVAAIKPMDWDRLYAGESWDSEGEKFCSNDTCELPVR